MSDALLSRLAEIRQLIEAHDAAVYLLEVERDQLRSKLKSSGWAPPSVEPPA